MNRKEVIERLKDLATIVSVDLRHSSRVPDEQFTQLTESLRLYRDLLEGEDFMEREVASYLHHLHMAFLGALDRMRKSGSEARPDLKERYEEFAIHLYEICDPWAQIYDEE
jgi:hypothetical protein